MKSKMKKKMIAFLLCMVLVICNSVSILADTPAAETTTTEKQAKETRTAKNEGTSEEEKSSDNSKDTSKSSEETEETKEEAPEMKTTKKKEETTGATTEKKEESTTATTTEKKEETEESTETSEKKETEEAEETATTGSEEETSKASEETTESKETSTEETGETTAAVTELKYEDQQVLITVSANEENAIPEGALLKIVPILKEDAETQVQYAEVEQKIQEKAAETEMEIKGFLAYDITFVDEDGNEIEPNSEVKVSMEYKQATIPAGLSEEDAKNTEVSVMHLEEDADGNVSQVVDMGEAGKVDTLETTDAQKVEKVEVKTESFSAFTITWKSNEIRVHFVSGADGSDIRDSMTLEDFFGRFGSGETADLAPEIAGYRFVKTKITDTYDQYEGTYDDDTYWALRLRKNSGQYQYNRARIDGAYEDKWLSINNQVYFIYKPDNYQITTRDSSSDGISLNLFNYDKSIKTKADAAGFPFFNSKSNHVDGSTNSPQTGGDVRNTLGNDGYPVSSNGASLDFLFGENAMTTNYLFKYDASTYSYEYDSEQNHAYYDEDAQRFYVYDYRISPADTRDSSYHDFEVGNFFPFNDVINPQQGRLNCIQYGREQRTNVDYWFGMSMGMNFYQPADGELPNGDAMKFEFRGDDDVFVYLDGVLILDLGGIHAAWSGTIDFSTGTIEENGSTIYDGIYIRYQESGLFTSEELADMFTEITVNGQTSHIFADYKNVDMDFFYLERGAGASNCHIKFNMPPIPDDTIIVGKQITDANASVYSDVEFSFMLETKAENESEYTPVKNKTVEVYDSTGELVDPARTVDNNGVFVLKHGERAYFEGYPVTTQYRVTELGVSSEEYDSVTITGVSVTQINSGGGSSEIPSYRTEDLTVSETPMVVFRNKIAASNRKELHITKQISQNDGNAQYQVKVYFGDETTDENGEAYQGSYWIDEHEYTATDGIIALTKGQTASIVDIPSGTSFKVVEVNLDTGIYNSPVYNVENADSIDTTDAASGEIRLKTDAEAEVTVTNSLKSAPDTPYIEIQKKFEGLDRNELPTNFQIELYKDADCTECVKTLDLSSENNNLTVSEDGLIYTWKLDDLAAGTYYLKERGEEVQNHTVTIKVNGQTVSISDNEAIEVKTQVAQYTFSNEDVIESCSDTQLISSTTNLIAGSFTNDRFFVWTEDTLSLGERYAIIDQINNQKGTFGKITSDNTDFFSTYERIEDGIDYRGTVSIEIDGTNASLNFTDPSQWRMVYYGTYEKSDVVNAEIEVENSYTENNTSIDLIKYGTQYADGSELSGAIFSLYKGNKVGNTITWEENPFNNEYTEFEVLANGNPELSLPSGYYKLVETEAPTGYQLLDDAIYFQVTKGTVQLINGESGEVVNSAEMWELTTSGTITIKVKNNIMVYNLPSAGGSGIYWYTLSGTLLMAGAALIVYRQKRKREVLLRK